MNKDKYYNIKIMNRGYGKTYYEMQHLITDLQQELQEANDSIIWWSNRFKAVKRDNRKLKQENERLNSQLDFIGEQNKYIDKLEKGYKNKVDEIGKLTSRIYKAIEYIKANCSYDEDTNMCCDDLFCGDVDNLLNILQNGSENDDR